jgi:hypothetical protein
MRLELKSGAVKLGPNQTLRVVAGEGTTVCAVEGSVWITEENQSRDIVLKAGACYHLASAAPSESARRQRRRVVRLKGAAHENSNTQ